MEVLELDGKKYVKAAAAARDLGYTADYVGQLCRSGKIDAHLVGRSWYVEKDSIRAHKAERHRSAKAKTKEALKDTLSERTRERHVAAKTAHAASTAPHNFYSKLSTKKVKYDEDQNELIPVLSEKKGNAAATVEVRLAGAEKLEVEKATNSYRMKPSERPEVHFSGELAVQEAKEDTPKEEKQDTEVPQDNGAAKEQEKIDTQDNNSAAESPATEDGVSHKRTELRTTDSGESEQQVPLRQRGVVAMTQDSRGSGAQTQELRITALPNRSHKSGRAAFLSITSSFVAALVLAAGTLLIDHSISSNPAEGSVEEGYTLNISNALSAIEALK